MRKSTSGFTIIEIIVVLVVLAILIAIVGSAYTTTQRQSRNADRFTEMKEWQRLLERHKARNGTYSGSITGNYCLGSGFPVGGGGVPRCRDYPHSGSTSYRQSDNTALMQQLSSVGQLPPAGPRSGVDGIIGPYVDNLGPNSYSIQNIFEGDESDCPTGTNVNYLTGNGAVMCGLYK